MLQKIQQLPTLQSSIAKLESILNSTEADNNQLRVLNTELSTNIEAIKNELNLICGKLAATTFQLNSKVKLFKNEKETLENEIEELLTNMNILIKKTLFMNENTVVYK